MPIEILMPALSPTMTEGNLAKWHKKEGDQVKSGDVLAEIETDKATMEVEAVDEGVLAKIVIPEGTDHVPINTPIAVIAENGEDSEHIVAICSRFVVGSLIPLAVGIALDVAVVSDKGLWRRRGHP